MNFFTNPGTPFRKKRALKIFDDGSSAVVVVGQENFQEYIQSFEKSCNIPALIARFASGDPGSVMSGSPMFGDFTSMPKNLTEMQQLMIDCQNTFDHLPVDVKQSFDNDVNKFIASVNSPDFLDKLGYSKPEQPSESEVSKDES